MATKAELKNEVDKAVKKAMLEMQKQFDVLKSDYDTKRTSEMAAIVAQMKLQNDDALKQLEHRLKLDFQVTLAKEASSFVAKVELLTNLNNGKDADISKLNREIGELQANVKITDDHISKIAIDSQETNTNLASVSNNIEDLNFKAADLEDRSKRQNLLFYGLEEEDGETDETCKKKIRNLIASKQLLHGNAHVRFDRVHRLGRKKINATRPRPIVCRFTFYEDKEYIFRNGKNLQGSEITMAEHYSWLTTTINSSLYRACKEAKQAESMIQRFYVNYRCAVVHYTNGKKKTFTLKNIDEGKMWYKKF